MSLSNWHDVDRRRLHLPTVLVENPRTGADHRGATIRRVTRRLLLFAVALVVAGCAVDAPQGAGQARIGTTYRYELDTMCGLNLVPIVLDGSEWHIAGDDGGSNPPPGFGNPDVGEIMLTSADRGIFRSSSGVERVITRVRDYVPPPSGYLVPCV
jgi:hypothetical protein